MNEQPCIVTPKAAVPPSVNRQDILEAFSYSPQHAELLDRLIAQWPKNVTTSDAVAALAWWIAQDLYSPESNSENNLERITFGLEAASGQLLSLKERLKNAL